MSLHTRRPRGICCFRVRNSNIINTIIYNVVRYVLLLSRREICIMDVLVRFDFTEVVFLFSSSRSVFVDICFKNTVTLRVCVWKTNQGRYRSST